MPSFGERKEQSHIPLVQDYRFKISLDWLLLDFSPLYLPASLCARSYQDRICLSPDDGDGDDHGDGGDGGDRGGDEMMMMVMMMVMVMMMMMMVMMMMV